MSAANSKGVSILVVEDDKNLRTIMVDLLETEGYQVAQAANGKEAISALREAAELPNLIVLDLMLPKMTGWDFRSALQEDTQLARIPVLVVSGIGPDLVSIAADGHLHKPLDLDSFLATVDKLSHRPAPPSIH